MKKQIVLIGDSIRMGYQETVRDLMAAEAELWWPDVNGLHTVNVLYHLHAWVQRRKPDIVHINAGLHDIRTVWFEGRKVLVPLEHYRANVRFLLETIRYTFGAKVAWATTTPVRDALHYAAHSEWRDFTRYNEDVLACNTAAQTVCAELGVPVNDLYTVAMEAGLETIQTQDGVHYTPEGCAILGRAVSEFLRRTFF